MDRILTACTRPTLAEGALYSYSRGGGDITARAFDWLRNRPDMGNTQSSVSVSYLKTNGGESTVEAFAWTLKQTPAG